MLVAFLVAAAGGALLLIPSLILLFVVFKVRGAVPEPTRKEY